VLKLDRVCVDAVRRAGDAQSPLRVGVQLVGEVARLDQQLVGQRFGRAAVAPDRAAIVDEQRQLASGAGASQQEQVWRPDVEAARDGSR
jgi:hypothetical protein